MAYISFKPTDYFNTLLYTGNGSARSLTGVGFQPDIVWMKGRSFSDNHILCDAVRGVEEYIQPDTNAAEGSGPPAPNESVTSFDADGFSIGGWSAINTNLATQVAWNWKMGTTSGLSGGTLTPSAYSINTTAKQGIYKYTGTGSTATIAHGLTSAPSAIFIKRLNGTNNWACYMKSAGNTKYTILNTDGAIQTGSAFWNDTSPTSTVFTIEDNVTVNTSGQDYVAYAFCDVPGYFQQGVYTGNADSTKGTFIYTGFSPAYVFVKNDASSENWHGYDNKRNTYNVRDLTLDPDQNSAESTLSGIDFTSNGFSLRTTATWGNGNAATYRYWAWAANPLIGSGGTPGLAE
mgnify:CR=1 FL=1